MELRERLRSLRSDASTKPERPAQPLPLPYLEPLQTQSGSTYYCDRIFIEHHGHIDLKDFPELPLEELRFLTLDRTLEDFSLRDAVFFDIETTGTAGGTGTYVFLAGFGFVDQGYFQVRQFFLHDLAEEAAFLDAVAEFSSRFRYLVTYNGKCFDAQMLRNRYLMHRREDPLAEMKHIDMLFVARRLWKRRYRDCDLMNLERNVLQFYRTEDIPGHLIPGAYVNYLRYANSSLIRRVIHHNQWDVVSLAVLAARAVLLRSRFEDLHPDEHCAIARLCERHREYPGAVQHLWEALQKTAKHPGALLALARNLRRIKDRERMLWLVEQSKSDALDAELGRKLSILCEHDLKDPGLALHFVEAQLQKLERFRGIATRENAAVKEWRHRRDRLLRKKAGFNREELFV